MLIHNIQIPHIQQLIRSFIVNIFATLYCGLEYFAFTSRAPIFPLRQHFKLAKPTSHFNTIKALSSTTLNGGSAFPTDTLWLLR